ncbi:PREDICTED: probable calcium-binding protein CML36 [Camelina sativa]|uniref:Probable calcium-binding protein CML36 n=1 Tax=Camelina sativa TaxID=90675 RepID=A0ABM0X5Y7_CAMSA|nr:PREDICTED: probable calcium-binding protein CML36 [Camelina sativa]
MKLAKLNPKRFFIRSKDRSTVSKSPASSFGSVSFSSGQDCIINKSCDGGGGGSVTPTSILPEVSCDTSPPPPYSYVEILQAFKLIDRDNDGAISRHDLESLLSRLGPDPLTEDEINVMIKEVGCEEGDDGTIRLEELASRVVLSLDPSRDSAELKETFEFFDADRDGLISAEELLRVFSTIGDERCTLDDCKRMIADVDEDGDGFVCFTEFSRMMMDLQR